MKKSQDLKRQLEAINHKGYPAYKSVQGAYDFIDYILSIDHVQGDPFASPSKVSIYISHAVAKYPATMFDKSHKRVALEDYLVRQFSKQLEKYNFKAKGSGKSGLIAISRPGPEILKRSACECNEKGIVVRFEVGFPANGRSIKADELMKIIFTFLPQCIDTVLYYKNRPINEVQKVIELAEDQYFIRQELKRLGLVAFVANQAILPRQSGVSSKPLKDSIPFVSPPSMQVEMQLPNYGKITGMGVPKGITLIVGGGYHGKSTLLKALEAGVYNHIAGDGREYVITDDSAIKLRAEDGRSVRNVDISLFINDLPNRKDTHCFSTMDASGSTSQAAAVIEGMEADSKLFLIDEDTSATNFMVRDSLMQQVVLRDKEPITPFIERVRDVYAKSGVSTIMVAGSSGAYFYIADKVIQMDCYKPYDITHKISQFCDKEKEYAITLASHYVVPNAPRKLTYKKNNYKESRNRHDRLKVKVFGKDSIQIGKESIDLRFVEQLIDNEQTNTLAQIMRYCIDDGLFEKYTVTEIVSILLDKIQKDGLPSLTTSGYAACGLAMPRKQEIYACINRYRIANGEK